jgi:cytidine deaminase
MIRTINLTFSYIEFENQEELDSEDRDLIMAAREAAVNAYAPYSKFRVGTAIRLKSGTMVLGVNVENAAFPSGVCAERSAISNMVSNHHDDTPVAMAIAAMTEDGLTEYPVPPCGNCRQAIAEEESRTREKIRIILSGKNKTYIINGINSLLPIQFNNNNLKVNLP